MRIHRVVPRNGHDPNSVRHNYVLALPGDEKSGFFKSPNRAEVCNSWYLRHTLCRDFDFPQVWFAGQFLRHCQVIVNGVPYVRQRFLFGGAL
jgi:hypothetical protein